MKTYLVLALVALLAACGGPGSEYLGRWVNSSNPENTLEIVRNGDSFLVKETRPALLGAGQARTSDTPAVLKDGVLRMETALGSVPVGHIKATDTLTVPGLLGNSTEYRRAE